jgi:hypothetical protein
MTSKQVKALLAWMEEIEDAIKTDYVSDWQRDRISSARMKFEDTAGLEGNNPDAKT